jgi:rod shape determining protein RodA
MKLWIIPAIILILGLLSILTLSSIAPALAPKQLIFFLIGFGLFAFFSKISFKRIQELSIFGYIGTIILLILTLFIGNVTKGSTRWIDVAGIFAVQPSQLAIMTTSIYLVTFFQNKPLTKLENLVKFLVITAIPGILILIEPDLGTTIVYLLSILVILFMSKTKKIHMMPLIAGGIVTVIIAWIFLLQPYQKSRITSFIYPSDTQGAGYNARQSLIAVGSGQITGRGLGQGIQSHLRFLPERQTDFVFASFAEEFGFIGSIVVVILYANLIWQTLKTAQNAKTFAEQLFCYVTAFMTTIQTGINIGMNIGLLPITGITLPFLSYGGSSILTLLIMFGIVQSIRINQNQKVTLHLE